MHNICLYKHDIITHVERQTLSPLLSFTTVTELPSVANL